MKTSYLKSVILFLCVGLFSCQSTTNSGLSEANAIESQEVEVKEEKQIEVSFKINTVEDDINGNKSTIISTTNGVEKEVAQAANCTETEVTEYESMKVPSDAIWACACWWAGAGDNFYAEKIDGKVNVYRKEIYEEMTEEEEKWNLIKTLY